MAGAFGDPATPGITFARSVNEEGGKMILLIFAIIFFIGVCSIPLLFAWAITNQDKIDKWEGF